MERIEKSIEVNAPLREVYNQWTQFEDFPRFMEGVEEVRQVDDKHLHWRAQIWGKEAEWDAEIYEQFVDRRIAWQSTSGHPNTGAVSFTEVGPERTRVNLVIEYEPLGAAEKMADFFGVVSSRVEGDLRRFRDFIEERGAATGAWRGQIPS